jgi:hypothetical protein
MKIPVTVAARMMEVTPAFIRRALRQERLPIGVAVECEGRWSYAIYLERVEKYLRGDDQCLNGLKVSR